MSKIREAFAKKDAFIPFITAGDPSLDKTIEYILELEKAGAALIELGIPFSDPIAEGPVVQAANVRALANGCTTDQVFEMVEKLRKQTNIPVVFHGLDFVSLAKLQPVFAGYSVSMISPFFAPAALNIYNEEPPIAVLYVASTSTFKVAVHKALLKYHSSIK